MAFARLPVMRYNSLALCRPGAVAVIAARTRAKVILCDV